MEEGRNVRMAIVASGRHQGGGGGDNDLAQAGSGEGNSTQSSTPMEPERADGMLVIPGTRSGIALCNPTRGKRHENSLGECGKREGAGGG